MSLCLEYNTDAFGGEERESEAYLYTAEGKFVERLPSISNIIPGANEYKGFRTDLGRLHQLRLLLHRNVRHLRRTVPGVAFTPDGQTTGAGSAYDNDIEHRSVELISRLPGGGMIPQNGDDRRRAIQFPGISTDGTHILMLTEGANPPGPPYHLYMRVNDALSYDVSKGTASEFVGMTRDGSSVTFTSEEQLTAETKTTASTSTGGRKATDTLTLLSVGNGNGNDGRMQRRPGSKAAASKSPTPNGATRCSGNPVRQSGVPYLEAQGLDDVIAENSGDVYFYSPELLDGTRSGIPNQRNLYVAHATARSSSSRRWTSAPKSTG